MRMSLTWLYGSSCTLIVGGPTNAREMVPMYGVMGARHSLIHSLHSRSRSLTRTGSCVCNNEPQPLKALCQPSA